MPSLYERQAISSCVSSCMVAGDLDGCSSLLEYACICRSAKYQASVAECWTGCDSQDVAAGQSFSQQRCQAVGVTLSTSMISGIAATATASIPASMTSVSITGTPSSWTEAPVLYTQTLVNIQAIMSSICAALFILAVVLGVVSCRNRIRRERGQTSSQWSGAGTFGDQTKYDPTASRFTTTTTRIGGRGQTDTFMSGISDFRQTVSFSQPLPSSEGAGVGAGRARFTNRMTVEEEDEEEWEMKDVTRDNAGAGGKEGNREEDVKTPTTATTSHYGEGDGEEGMGSTVHLNQVNVLDKGHGRAV